MRPATNKRYRSGRSRWWTRDRIIQACANFYRTHKYAPTNDGWWQEVTRGTGRRPDGYSNKGYDRPYPSFGAIKNYWKSFRDLWSDVAKVYPGLELKLDKGDTPWSALEEWFIVESIGVLPRCEVARLMDESGCGRTEAAIKRRLYELGVNCYNRWGWTVNHLAAVLELSSAVIMNYIDHGLLPFFQGNRCLYIEPADFLVIQEYDWSKPEHPAELEEAVRKSLMQRLCFILMGFDWRAYSYHRIGPRTDIYTGRKKYAKRKHPPPTEKPTHIKVGDWVSVSGPWAFQPGGQGRVGQVKRLFWSSERQPATLKRPERAPCWVASVDFRKLKAHGSSHPRVHYSLPVTSLTVTANPYPAKTVKPKRERPRRVGRMKRAGATVLSNRLNVSQDISELPIDTQRKVLAIIRGKNALENRLNLPTEAVGPEPSRRGQRPSKTPYKVAV